MPRVYKFYSNPTRFSDDFSILGERQETKVAFAKSQRDAQPMQSLHVVSVYVCGCVLGAELEQRRISMVLLSGSILGLV